MSKLLPLDLFIRQALLYPLTSPFLPPENKVFKDYSYAAGKKIGSFEAIDWDLLYESCNVITTWANGDFGVAVSEVDPAGQFRHDTNAGAAGNAYTYRTRDIGSIPNTFTFEVKLYHDALGTLANNDHFEIYVCQADEALKILVGLDGLFIADTDSGNTEVGTDLVKEGVSAEWQIWRFLVTFTGTTGEGTCDVYLKDNTHDWEKVGTNIPCSLEAALTDGLIITSQKGYTTDDIVTHIDYIKIATGHFAP